MPLLCLYAQRTARSASLASESLEVDGRTRKALAKPGQHLKCTEHARFIILVAVCSISYNLTLTRLDRSASIDRQGATWRLSANVQTSQSALTECVCLSSGACAEEARAIFTAMKRSTCRPDALTHTALATACQCCGDWAGALKVRLCFQALHAPLQGAGRKSKQYCVPNPQDLGGGRDSCCAHPARAVNRSG